MPDPGGPAKFMAPDGDSAGGKAGGMGSSASVPRSLGDVAYGRIRGAIQQGLLVQGARVREIEVADWLGMSRTPVREALRRLETEGLLSHEPHRGMVIASLDQQAVAELYAMRQNLEGMAAEQCALHATAAEVAVLRDLLKVMRELPADPARQADQNRQFHDALFRAAHNRYLIKAYGALRDGMILLGPTTLAKESRIASANEEHQAMLDAIEARDADAARAAARNHIESAQIERLHMLSGLEGAE